MVTIELYLLFRTRLIARHIEQPLFIKGNKVVRILSKITWLLNIYMYAINQAHTSIIGIKWELI